MVCMNDGWIDRRIDGDINIMCVHMYIDIIPTSD